MTKIIIKKNKEGNIVAFEAKGHASKLGVGHDIYCAAVSAIIQTAVIGLNGYAGIRTALETEDGYLYCSLPKESASDIRAEVITSTMLMGLKAFDEENKGFIKIIEEVL